MLFKYRDSSLAAPLLMQMQSAPFHVLSLIDTSNSNNVEEEIENVRLSVLIVKDIAHVSFGPLPSRRLAVLGAKGNSVRYPQNNSIERMAKRDTTTYRPLPVLYKMGMNPIQPLVEFLNIHYRGHDVSMVILSMPRKTPM